MKFSTFEITVMVEVICMIVVQRGKSFKKIHVDLNSQN